MNLIKLYKEIKEEIHVYDVLGIGYFSEISPSELRHIYILSQY